MLPRGSSKLSLQYIVKLSLQAKHNRSILTCQVSNLPLGKRARYYQSNMDLDCLEASTDYTALKKCYVIFICTFDYFKKDAPVYFFRSWDVEKGLPLDDFS